MIPPTFEERFASLRALSVMKADVERKKERPNEDGDEGQPESRRGTKTRMASRREGCKLDFHIVDGMFCCKVAGCEEEEGFFTFPELKDHFDLLHALTGGEPRSKKDVVLEEDDFEGDHDDPAWSGEEHDADQIEKDAQVEVVDVSKKAEDEGKMNEMEQSKPSRTPGRFRLLDSRRKKKPFKPKSLKRKNLTDLRPQEGEGEGGTSEQPKRAFLQCHVCVFKCRNRLDLESHTK